MAAGAVSSARDPQHDVRWKWLLLGLCAIGGVLLIASFADNFGMGQRPWLGWWDGGTYITDRAYITEVSEPLPGGASAKAGLRIGDLVDLREQSFDGRVHWIFEPIASRPVRVRIHRGTETFTADVRGSTDVEHSPLEYAQVVLLLLSAAWFLACATLIAARRWWTHEARVLALAMICQVASGLLDSGYFVAPNAGLQLLSVAASSAFLFIEVVLLVRLSSRYGRRVAWRRLLEWFAYITNAILFVVSIVALLGLASLWIDPLPLLISVALPAHLFGGYWWIFNILPGIGVVLCMLVAVFTSTHSERPRAAWLLLPIPLSLLGVIVGVNINAVAAWSWLLGQALTGLGILCWLLGGLFVTYALLNRRVLDFGFVLGRAVVVSVVGLIVVIAFVLLEWVLGSMLTGASHATGLIANAALALVIGVSLNYIHKRVDQSVDLVLFRKRHDDERALLAFSKEAAYITEWDALLDATLEKVRRHTDSRSAAVLIGANGLYSAVRSFGDNTVTSVNENDEAILALKVWHKPIDPHHYDTTLHAALALPMLSRGKLYGVLILGERAGGEAYTSDEVEALSQLANGVGSALEALSMTTDGSATALAEHIAGLHQAIASMGDTLAAEMRSEMRALRTSSSA